MGHGHYSQEIQENEESEDAQIKKNFKELYLTPSLSLLQTHHDCVKLSVEGARGIAALTIM